MKDAVLWLLRWVFWKIFFWEDSPGFSVGMFSKPNDMIDMNIVWYVYLQWLTWPFLLNFFNFFGITYLVRNLKFKLLVQGPLAGAASFVGAVLRGLHGALPGVPGVLALVDACGGQDARERFEHIRRGLARAHAAGKVPVEINYDPARP